MRLRVLKRLLVGSPIPTERAQEERLSKPIALAVFASDNLSSVAYATEEILRILILAGSAALTLTVPIGAAISLVIAIVVYSYRQTILAYPQGGGGYIVAKDNLGTLAGLTAGAALLTDYILTVAVSVSAGVAAVTSALPVLFPYRVSLCVTAVAVLTIGNLRGARQSGKLFALPTYGFLGGFLLLLGAGFVSMFFQPPVVAPHPSDGETVIPLTVFLVLRAFAAGCVALTGTEAVADGVIAFKPPEARNARTTLTWMGLIFMALFFGITVLSSQYGIVPREEETMVSQLARQIFDESPLYYLIQVFTMLILILAANTSFADFPRLSFFLARDGFIPRQFAHRGDRLVFSNGVLILAVVAALLIVVFNGDTHALIPLYTIGVFVSFTLSQSAMVRRWMSRREPGWWWRAGINGLGALTTAVVLIVVTTTKFTHGAWIVVVLVPLLMAAFLTVNRHYRQVAKQLSLEEYESPPPLKHTVFVLVGDLHRGVIPALQYAKSISPDAHAIYIEQDPEKTKILQEKWQNWGQGVPLMVLQSPYRSLLIPLLRLIRRLQHKDEHHLITIVLPEFIPARWWQHLLHNQTALLIKGALLFWKGVIVIDVPYHLEH